MQFYKYLATCVLIFIASSSDDKTKLDFLSGRIRWVVPIFIFFIDGENRRGSWDLRIDSASQKACVLEIPSSGLLLLFLNASGLRSQRSPRNGKWWTWTLNIYLHACAIRTHSCACLSSKFFAFAISFVFISRFSCHVRFRACLFAANSGDTGTSRLASESQNREPGETDGFFPGLLFRISICERIWTRWLFWKWIWTPRESWFNRKSKF